MTSSDRRARLLRVLREEIWPNVPPSAPLSKGEWEDILGYDVFGLPGRHRIREATAADIPACVAIMRGNVPEFFLEHEVAEFESWLCARSSPYLVVTGAADQPAACGGYAIDPEERFATLTWGMVDRRVHRQGLGSLLLRDRIARIVRDGRATELRLQTSQHSRPFFERHGFEATAVAADGYGPASTAATCGCAWTRSRRAIL